MSLPYFFIDSTIEKANVELNEETSRHVVQVLRMKEGEQILLTNGKGETYNVEISEAHKKHCKVTLLKTSLIPKDDKEVSIAISLLKNSSRFEWFLEKAVEIGVQNIIPLICNRTEKQHFRFDRMQAITISAMLQSQQAWLPSLSQPVKFKDLFSREYKGEKFIAHCEEDDNKKDASILFSSKSKLLLIGPEGDFNQDEIKVALENKFIPVSLGNTRLRTETAGIVAASLMCIAK